MTSSEARPRRTPNVRMLQNFHLVWLDESIDEEKDGDCRKSIQKLQQVVNTVNTFTDVDECIDFITDINEEMTSIVVSEEIIEIIAPIVQEIPQINSIYVFCENETQPTKWTKECFKIKGVFTNITTICEALKQAVQKYDHNSVAISFIKSTDTVLKQNLDTLDQSFMYTQILKEILLTIDFHQSHINEFAVYCREKIDGNTGQLAHVDKIEKEYHHHKPIWWYTYEPLLYSMVNRALRLMEVDLIIKMGFFIRDLHSHIAELHNEQFSGKNHSDTFIVYRGQGLSYTDFDQLRNTQGGLMSFNNFLSTSTKKDVSYVFAESTTDNPNLIGVLFEITIDPSILSSLFATISSISSYEDEEEILFSMHSVFRIVQVQQIEENNRLYQVNLTLTNDNDPQLYALTKSMQEETLGSTGWHRLGHLMIKLGQFNQAEELYNVLFEQTNDQREKAHLYHQLGFVKGNQGEYVKAVQFFEKTLEIWQKAPPANHPDLSTLYNNIGLVYKSMGEYSKALSYLEKALEIWQKALPENDPVFAAAYNNIGSIYQRMGEYSKALFYFVKALEIWQKALLTNHPDLAISYNNIGMLYKSMGEYLKALSHYEKALEIWQKVLPANHPDLAATYNNIGMVYYNMGEYSKALSYFEKDLEIWQKTLPKNHPDLATSYNNIGMVYHNMGEYSKALSYFEKALYIRKNGLPANHPDLATSCNNIGMVYKSMGEYSKALSYFEKDLEIWQKVLPANHPDLAATYNNIGLVYYTMGEYSKAFFYFEKALKIWQKALPENHPDLATSYNNIGLVYHNIKDYLKALSYFEKALYIQQNGLPENHPDLATSYSNIGWVYRNKGDYSKALSYYERALDIRKRSLPPNHPDITNVEKNIETVKEKLK